MGKILQLNIVRALMVGLFVFVGAVAGAQNLGGVKSDQLTDEQLKRGIQKALESGMTPAQIEGMARAQGMSPTEIQRLKARMEKMYGSSPDMNTKLSAKDGSTDGLLNGSSQMQGQGKSGFNYTTIDYPDFFNTRSKNGTPA